MVTRPEAIAWEAAEPAARARAVQEGKPILLSFTAAPRCQASVLMDNGTFTDAGVVAFIARHFVPVRIDLDKEPVRAVPRAVAWTPAVLFLDEQGVEQYRVEGYFLPHDLLARLSLGYGRYCLNHGRFEQAADRFEEVVHRHAASDAAAEALYGLGVAQFKQANDQGRLRACWQKLIQNYPASDWANRARVPDGR